MPDSFKWVQFCRPLRNVDKHVVLSQLINGSLFTTGSIYSFIDQLNYIKAPIHSDSFQHEQTNEIEYKNSLRHVTFKHVNKSVSK